MSSTDFLFDHYKSSLKKFNSKVRKAMLLVRYRDYLEASFELNDACDYLINMKNYLYAISCDQEFDIQSIDDYEEEVRKATDVNSLIRVMAYALTKREIPSLVNRVKKEFDFEVYAK